METGLFDLFDEWNSLYGIQEDTVSAIGYFTIVWNMFENLYMNKHANEKKIIEDNYLIEMSESQDPDLNNLIGRYRIEALKSISKDEDSLNTSDIIQYFYHNSPGKYISEYLSFFRGEDANLSYCLGSICRIRNNLLHGEKTIFSINQQKELIGAAADILAYLTTYEKMHSHQLRCLDN